MTTAGPFVIIAIDPRLARGMRLELRRFPVRVRHTDNIVDGEGRIRVGRLADELHSLVAEDPELAAVYRQSISRLALFASREADRDGFLELRVSRSATMAHAWAPADRECAATLAIAQMMLGLHEQAAEGFATVLAHDARGMLMGLRILAAKNALILGDGGEAVDFLTPLEPDAADGQVARLLTHASAS